jgi:hypothetical protein
MCDLNPQETAHIGEALAEISALTEQINAQAAAIADTAFMDHETLARLLGQVRDIAGTAQQWVADKPHQHAGHATH